MDISTNRKLASVVLIAAIVIFSLFGASRSLRAEAGRVSDMFYNGAENPDGYAEKSIQYHLDNIVDAANGFLAVDGQFSRTVLSAENLRGARQSLIDAKTLPEKYEAYKNTVSYGKELYGVLSAAELSKDQKQMLEYYNTELLGAANAIDKLSYNREVAQFYNDTTAHFPASFFAGLFKIEGPVYFTSAGSAPNEG